MIAAISSNVEKPPLPVRIAVSIIGVSIGLGFVLFELSESVSIKRPSREVTTIILGALIFAFLRAVYRGKQWTQIVLLCFLLLSLLGALRAVASHSGFERGRVVFQLTLELIAFCLLLLPASSTWFRSRRHTGERKTYPDDAANRRARSDV